MSEELCRLGNTVASFTFNNSLFDNRSVPLWVEVIGLLLGRVTLIEVLGWMFYKILLSSSLQ